MIRAIVYGYDLPARTLAVAITKGYNFFAGSAGGEEIGITGFADWNGDAAERVVDGYPVLSEVECRRLRTEGMAEYLLMPRESYRSNGNYLMAWHKLGFAPEEVLLARTLKKENLQTAEDYLNLLDPIIESPYLPYLEYHIADHCNLNCAYCEHYSGLVEEPVFPEFEEMQRDFRQMKQLITEIGIIRILGGEPLLNPEIEKYMRLTRETYPEAVIFVVSNGLLADRMPETFYERMKELHIFLWISLYPPMERRIGAVKEFLESRHVQYTVSPLNTIFSKKQVLTAADDAQRERIFLQCYQHSCVNLYKGQLATCFLPFTTKYFNRTFAQNLPEDGAISLYEEGLTTADLKHRLMQPFERCRYCDVPEDHSWRTMHRPSVLSDWVKE